MNICGKIRQKRKDGRMHIARWCCVVCAAVLALMGVRTMMAEQNYIPEESFHLYSEPDRNIRASGRTYFLKLKEIAGKGYLKQISSSNTKVATAEPADGKKTKKPIIALNLKRTGTSTLRFTYCDGQESYIVEKKLVVEKSGKSSYRIRIYDSCI